MQKSSNFPPAGTPPRLAASAKWFHDISRMDWLCRKGLAIQYTPDPEDFATMSRQLSPYLEQGIAIRFHAFFPEYEIGDQEEDVAAKAMDIHEQFLELVASFAPEAVITGHLGLSPARVIDCNRAADNLGLLVRQAKELGLTLAIENLRQGPSSDAVRVWQWAETADSALTLDIGHALSSLEVMEGRRTVHEIIDLFSTRMVEVHYYERESDKHYPPRDMAILGPVVDHLLRTPCKWWTIELEELSDIEHTVKITSTYLASQAKTDKDALVIP